MLFSFRSFGLLNMFLKPIMTFAKMNALSEASKQKALRQIVIFLEQEIESNTLNMERRRSQQYSSRCCHVDGVKLYSLSLDQTVEASL